MTIFFQPPADIMAIVTDLKESGLNSWALENAAEIALKSEYFELAWSLFKKFTNLRPHFFWPILLSAGRKEGELGRSTNRKTFSEMLHSFICRCFDNFGKYVQFGR